MRKSKQCGQKQREERERPGNGISYIKMRSTVLSVQENITRACDSANHYSLPCKSAANQYSLPWKAAHFAAVWATSPHRTADSRNQTKQTTGIRQSRHPRAQPNLCLIISAVCIKISDEGKASWPREKPSLAKKLQYKVGARHEEVL